ncbi:MAG: glycosyltransferase [Pirellulaceae bacterium]|nr:glycosyltransferase [Pirellulaceae bacterium]
MSSSREPTPSQVDVPAGSPQSVLRQPRRGQYPAVPPAEFADRPIRVAIVYAVLYRFRMPIFRRLSSDDGLRVKILVGQGVPGTKFSNAPDASGVDAEILWTLQKQVVSTGRSVTMMFNPTLPFRLWRFRPDVLLIQGGMLPNNWLTWAYSKLTGTPVVWWSLGEVRERKFNGLSGKYRKWVRAVEKTSDAFAGYSSPAVDYFLSQGYPEDRCFNLVNVVDTDLVAEQMHATQDQVPALRKQLGLEGQQVILFVGSLIETKGIDTLLRAFARLDSAADSAKLLIVGDGPERENAERLAVELEITERVIFVGAVYEGVSTYFQLGDLLVLPGTGGLAISEGMAHGLPVICSIGDGVELDLIDDGENGFCVPPKDVDVLAEKIAHSLESPERLQEMGEHSLKIIRERANIDRYLNEMRAAIFRALERR